MLDGWLQKGTIPRDVLETEPCPCPSRPLLCLLLQPRRAAGTYRICASSPARSPSACFVPVVTLRGAIPCGHPPRGHALWSPSARPRPVVTLCASSPAWSPSARLRPALVTRGFTFTHSLTRYILNWSRPGDFSCAGRGAQGHVTWDTNVTSRQDDGLHQ